MMACCDARVGIEVEANTLSVHASSPRLDYWDLKASPHHKHRIRFPNKRWGKEAISGKYTVGSNPWNGLIGKRHVFFGIYGLAIQISIKENGALGGLELSDH
jgi:hypothetical protein